MREMNNWSFIHHPRVRDHLLPECAAVCLTYASAATDMTSVPHKLVYFNGAFLFFFLLGRGGYFYEKIFIFWEIMERIRNYIFYFVQLKARIFLTKLGNCW